MGVNKSYFFFIICKLEFMTELLRYVPYTVIHSSILLSGIAILLCICLHCVTSDNSNETTSSTAFPIFTASATQEYAHQAIIENISLLITTTTTTKSPITTQVTTETNVPSPQTIAIVNVETSPLPDDKIEHKSTSTILSSIIPIINNNNVDVTQSTTTEQQEKDIDTTTTPLIIKQTELSTSSSVTATTTTTTTTTESTTISLPLSTKTTQVSVTEKTFVTTQTKSASVDLCLESHIINLLPDPKLTTNDINYSTNQFSVNLTKGDITITVISKKFTSAQFVVNRINELKLIRDNVMLGEYYTKCTKFNE